MNNITLAQREALDVVKDMIDKSNTSVPEFGTKILTLILGILNIDCRVEHTTIDIGTDIKGDSTIPINPNNGSDNDKLQIPDWIKNVPTPPFSPHAPYPEQVWYNQETEPIQPTARELRYATNAADFRDGQTSFNDK